MTEFPAEEAVRVEPPARNIIPHENGDEEWSLEAALETFKGDATRFINASGAMVDLTQELDNPLTPARVPKLLLV